VIEIKHLFTEEVLLAVPQESLVGAKLSGASLSAADLGGQDLQRADLRGADLSAAGLAGANLAGCNLRDANLTGACMIGANLRGADLRGARLAGADLGHSGLEEADLSDVVLEGTNLIGAELSRARLQGADLSNAMMKYASLTGAEFDERTQFPALLFDPESRGAVRAAAGVPPEPAPLEGAAWDAGEQVLECLFQRASDATTLSLSVRTSGGWLLVERPTEALAGLVVQSLASPEAEVRAYRVGPAVGLIVRSRR
jgi:hypothetical protein